MHYFLLNDPYVLYSIENVSYPRVSYTKAVDGSLAPRSSGSISRSMSATKALLVIEKPEFD